MLTEQHTILVGGRYVRRDARVYPDSHCLFCGTCYGITRGEPRACRIATCLACKTPQCASNGACRGQCGICLVGLLPGWAGSVRQCTYKGCTRVAVAVVKRWPVCLEHLDQRAGTWHSPHDVREGRSRTLEDALSAALYAVGAPWVFVGPKEVPWMGGGQA